MLYRVIAALLVLIAVALAANHLGTIPQLDLARPAQVAARLAAGVGSIVAALMCVAGGEPLISTIVLLYAVDLKLAGSLSLAVSLLLLVAFARYSGEGPSVLAAQARRFVLAMAAGSVTGTIAGGLMVGAIPTSVLVSLLVVLLLASAVEV